MLLHAIRIEDAGQRIELATPCCCRACVECHRKWIEEQDSKQKDATCLGRGNSVQMWRQSAQS